MTKQNRLIFGAMEQRPGTQFKNVTMAVDDSDKGSYQQPTFTRQQSIAKVSNSFKDNFKNMKGVEAEQNASQ